jgi:hypothetical protein
MSVKITIGSTVINFPTSGTDANWAEAVTEFALATQSALAGVGLPYDVAPQVISIIESGNQDLAANFPNAFVRAFSFDYSTYRLNVAATESKTQSGMVIGVYNETTNDWTLQHEFTGDKKSDGDSFIKFTMNGDTLRAQVTWGLATPYDGVNSKISFSAKTLPVSN